MDIFFTDPDEIPLPPDEVRILALEARPWPDGRRVQVYFEITPFQKRPYGEISITNARGDELASISIIEPAERKLEFTLHLRGADLIAPFTVSSNLFYYPPAEASTESSEEVQHDVQNRIIMDERQISIEPAEPGESE